MPDGDRAAERAGRDSVTVLALLAVGVDSAALLIKGGPRPALLALAGAAAGVVISWRRPRRGLAVTVIACAGSILAGWDPTALWTVAVFTVFTATLAGVSALIVGGTVAVALYLLIAFWEDASLSAPAAVIASVTAIAAAGIGGALRAQLRYWTVVEQRAADAIAARQQEIDREVVEDRLRIARDLHDLIGHEVAVLNMQLGRRGSQPPRARGPGKGSGAPGPSRGPVDSAGDPADPRAATCRLRSARGTATRPRPIP